MTVRVYNDRALLILIPIALVMYFSLLYARFEGERYAPGRVEKGIVLALCGMIGFATYLIMIGFGAYQGGGISYLFLAPGLLVAYAFIFPVRMMLRMKTHPIEGILIRIGFALGMVCMIAFALFAQQ